MASTSASSIQKSFKYDVFLSFRGEDTRKTFVDHLYDALLNKSIITYKDDERIKKGEKIGDQLLRSIEESRFHIIVFSKNYASSSWCLEELVKIMECQKTIEQTAYPVFYDVEPTEVRYQSGVVGEAFANHVGKEGIGRWRCALREVADLAGWELKNTNDGYEAKLIQKIVREILSKLHFVNLSDDGKLQGMETRMKEVVTSLEIDSDDVRMIGIKGMGGAGKTTLARAVFDYISMGFEGKSFVENVRERSKGSGLKELQKQILSSVLNDQSIVVPGVSDGKNMMKRHMCSRKVLVILDDVDHLDQLEALAGDLNWFKLGSRIIITTRDEQVLVAHEVHRDNIHNVSLLSFEEAICLFNVYAFKKENPSQEYQKLSKKFIQYAAGLPLTIKVLGSFLCGRSKCEWEETIERLKAIPLKETIEKLELSYNGLENDHKEIFLDVACILKGERKDAAIKVLESCGYHARIGLSVLEQKSLITTSDDIIALHDHLEEMGMNIVRRMHPNDPSKHTRLWIQEEIEDILVNDLGTQAIKSIKLKNKNLQPAVIMKGLRNVKELRVLYVHNSYSEYSRLDIDEVGQYLPDTLRSLLWFIYPFQCLPATFRATNLVNLVMEKSNISQLWEAGEKKVLNKLKFLCLKYSNLRSLDLHLAPNLEMLDLVGCKHFVELTIPHECQNIKYLNLIGSKLINLKFGLAPNLETLDLQGCNNFVELTMPHECPNLKYLNLSGSKLIKLEFGSAPNLETLYLGECEHFVELTMPHECPNLKYLILSSSKLINLKFGLVPNLEIIDLEKCYDFVKLTMPYKCPNFKYLNLSGSKLINLKFGLAPHLETLNLKGCKHFEELTMPHECPNLKYLDLSGSKLINLKFGLAPNLETLDLEGCKDFVELTMTHECPNLKYLNLSGSKVSNLNLELTPNIERLLLEGCYYLQDIHAPMGCLKKLHDLNLKGCLRFQNLSFPKWGKFPSCLLLIAKSLEICPLHPNSRLPKFQFRGGYYDDYPSVWSGNIEKLISFGLCACTDLDSFSASICGLQHLIELTLAGSIPEVPKDLGQLESLEDLTLSLKEIKHLPDSICMLKHMKRLKLKSCGLLERLPTDLGRLEHLEVLDLTDCRSLRDIPNSICEMKCLKGLRLSYCVLVEKLPKSICQLKHMKHLKLDSCWLLERLPEDLGRLEHLEGLDLTNCFSLRDIPNSICELKCLKHLLLSQCLLVEKLPEEFGKLNLLKELDIEGAGISHLPHSIARLKGLRVIGSRGQLELCGFTSIGLTTINSRYVTVL